MLSVASPSFGNNEEIPAKTRIDNGIDTMTMNVLRQLRNEFARIAGDQLVAFDVMLHGLGAALQTQERQQQLGIPFG